MNGIERMAENPTHAERLREELAELIVAGEFRPGTRLDEIELARRFGTSRTPVREAFKALAAIGMVIDRPRRGAIVAMPSNTQIEGMFEVMAELEALCARFSALRMTAAERMRLEEMHHLSLRLVHEGDSSAYSHHNNEFHSLIYRGSHNEFLEDTARTVRRRVLPFRHSQFRVAGRLGNSHAEHDAVVTAILRGDAAGAEAAMRVHVGKVTVASIDYVSEHAPDRAMASDP